MTGATDSNREANGGTADSNREANGGTADSNREANGGTTDSNREANGGAVEPNPDADDPHAVLGVPTAADREQIRLAASVAKQRYNPDRYPETEKRRAREQFYEVVAAEEALLDGHSEADGDDTAVSTPADAGLSQPATPRLTVDGDHGPWEPRVPAGESVVVRVHDGEDGRALAGVPVAARSLASAGGSARAETDANGRAVFDITPGRWVVRVDSANGANDGSDANNPNASGPVAVRVARPAPGVDTAARDDDRSAARDDDRGVSHGWLVRLGTLATVVGLAGVTLAVALGWPPVAWATSVGVGVAGVAGLWRAVA